MTQERPDKDQDTRRFSLEPVDRIRLANMVGPEDENLKQIAKRLGVEILNAGANFSINGKGKKAIAAERIIKQLYLETAPLGKNKKPQYITPDKVNLAIIENTQPRSTGFLPSRSGLRTSRKCSCLLKIRQR